MQTNDVSAKLQSIQTPRANAQQNTTVNLITEVVVVTVEDFIAKYQRNEERALSILEWLEESPAAADYPKENHQAIADLASRFDVTDVFVQPVYIGNPANRKDFLHNYKKTFSKFFLKYETSGQIDDFDEVVVRIVAQQGFKEKFNIHVVGRPDFQQLENIATVKKSKKG